MRCRVRLWASRAAVLCTALAAGCDRSEEFQIVPVAGRVVHGGQPVVGAHVSFQPLRPNDTTIQSGPGSFALTDEQGRFRLELQVAESGRMGAVVGKHVVRVTPRQQSTDIKSDVAPPETIGDPLPPKASDGTLIIEIPPGGDENLEIEL